jgi:hypothetical protein
MRQYIIILAWVALAGLEGCVFEAAHAHLEFSLNSDGFATIEVDSPVQSNDIEVSLDNRMTGTFLLFASGGIGPLSSQPSYDRIQSLASIPNVCEHYEEHGSTQCSLVPGVGYLVARKDMSSPAAIMLQHSYGATIPEDEAWKERIRMFYTLLVRDAQISPAGERGVTQVRSDNWSSGAKEADLKQVY